MIRCFAWTPLPGAPFITTVHFTSLPSIRIFASSAASRSSITLSIIAVTSSVVSSVCFSSPAIAEFSEIPNSGGVKSLDLQIGDGEVPIEGDQSIVTKVRYAKQRDLLGYFSWHIGADDNSRLSRAALQAWDAKGATTIIL